VSEHPAIYHFDEIMPADATATLPEFEQKLSLETP
jgi:hypothetical protein